MLYLMEVKDYLYTTMMPRGSAIYKLILSFLIVMAVIYFYNKSSFHYNRPGGGGAVVRNETVRVDIYYEVLCPDSRHFVIYQLFPTWRQYQEIMEVNLIPYGKATTQKLDGGQYKFECQHGPIECLGNKFHSCAVKGLPTSQSLPYVVCMIENNNKPEHMAESCALKSGISFTNIKNCAESREGDTLLSLMGEMTHALSPPVSFIPTVEIEGSQDRFRDALKDLAKQVCREYKSKFNKVYPKCRGLVKD